MCWNEKVSSNVLHAENVKGILEKQWKQLVNSHI